MQGTENALIQLGISYPVTTRATEEGLTSEQTFETAKVIVNGDIHTYEYKDFRIGENDNTLYLKDGIPVSAGEASIYVILNLQGEPTTPYASMTASANYVSTLDGLTGYVAAKATWDYVSKDIVGNVQESTPDANSNITYCLENKDANNTRVVYEAVATWGE